MLQVRINDKEALEELKQVYGVKRLASLFYIIRKVVPKLLAEDDMIELIFPLSFLSKSYRYNVQAFVQHLNFGGTLKVYASKKAASQLIILRIGFGIPTFGFAKNLTNELRKDSVHSVDVLIEDIPDSYRQQPYHFLNRLSTRLGMKIKHLVLGDTIRFIKPSKTKQEKLNEKFKVKNYKKSFRSVLL